MERGRRKRRGVRTATLFLLLVFTFMAVARAVEERSDAGNVNVGRGGEEEAFDKRFLKLWTDGGGGDEEDHLRWYGNDDEYDQDEEVVENDGDTIMLGGAKCPEPTKKKKKKRNVVRVDDFGAAGNGCTDDTEVHPLRTLG
jgi:hypothetical protein